MKRSTDAALKVLNLLEKGSTILDIGAGDGEHADFFRSKGHVVDTVDINKDATYFGDFNTVNIEKQYDCVWASHCLEHQLNVNNFLCKVNDVCKENGIVAITVPPLKHSIVGGHVNLWNGGLLVYNLVLANFDCSQAMVKKYGYNISVVVRKKYIDLPKLKYGEDDLITLSNYLPVNRTLVKKKDRGHFAGDIGTLNW